MIKLPIYLFMRLFGISSEISQRATSFMPRVSGRGRAARRLQARTGRSLGSGARGVVGRSRAEHFANWLAGVWSPAGIGKDRRIKKATIDGWQLMLKAIYIGM